MSSFSFLIYSLIGVAVLAWLPTLLQVKTLDKTKKTEEMEYIDYGLSYINRDYFLKNTRKTPFDFSLFLSATVEKKMATAFVAKEMFQEIGSPEGYSRFLRLLEKNNFSLEKLRLLVK